MPIGCFPEFCNIGVRLSVGARLDVMSIKKRFGFDVSCLCCAVDGGVRLFMALELVGVDQVLCDRSIEQLELVRGWSTIALVVGGSLS